MSYECIENKDYNINTLKLFASAKLMKSGGFHQF
jgi:hypothetical protein